MNLNPNCYMPINKKTLFYLTSFIVFFLAFNTAYSSSDYGDDTTSFSSLSGQDSLQLPGKVTIIKGPSRNKEIANAKFLKLKFEAIQPIKEPIIFKEGLTLPEYRKFIKDKLKSEYPNAFKDKFVSMYFFRALAENMYAQNGYLYPKAFNSIIKGRKSYYAIRPHIIKVEMKNRIKLFILHLLLVKCIYTREFSSVKEVINKINKIPKDPILYLIAPSIKNPNRKTQMASDQNTAMYGKYMVNAIGGNLYYILASYYPDFVNLPIKTKMRILKNIFVYNPTLTKAPPVKASYSFLEYIKEFFIDSQDPLLKYRLSGGTRGWLILPRSLSIYTKDKKTETKDA